MRLRERPRSATRPCAETKPDALREDVSGSEGSSLLRRPPSRTRRRSRIAFHAPRAAARRYDSRIMRMLLFIPLVLLLVAAAPDEPPIVLGVIASSADGDDPYVVAAREAVDARNAAGGVGGRQVRLVVESHGGTEAGLKKALVQFDAAGAVAVLGPVDAALADGAEKGAAGRRLPHLRVAPRPEQVGAAAAEFLREKLRTRRIGVVTDGSRAAKATAKELEGALEHPYGVALSLPVAVDAKGLARKLEKSPVDVFLIDATSDAAIAAVDGPVGATGLPVVLTPRAAGDGRLPLERPALALLGRSPATVASSEAFLVDWRAAHGEPRFGVGEGADGIAALLAALGDGTGLTRDSVAAALDGATLAGTRGPVKVEGKEPALVAPLAVWRFAGGEAAAYLPPSIPADVLAKGTAAQRDVDPTLGVPFGAWRSDRFEVEEKTQWVLFSFGEPEESTIDEDLRAIGLSSGGEAPLVDHLIKEELMARLLGVNARKWLRNDDGTSIPGESLRISFTTWLPEKAKRGKVWTAVVAGDDDAAGGRAYPGSGRAEIYSTFIRRTIYEPHALDPPVSADDLPYLDGSYRFGEDRLRDKRSELIRSLINAYAGSMALTAAHEIGHLAGLGHITHDPFGIMNVEEGAGIDHADGHFCGESLEKLVQRFGRVPE